MPSLIRAGADMASGSTSEPLPRQDSAEEDMKSILNALSLSHLAGKFEREMVNIKELYLMRKL